MNPLWLECAVLVPVGPTPAELLRVDDLIGSLATHERTAGPVFFLNDGANAAALQTALDEHGLHGAVLPHPHAGRGNAWMGRLTAGLAHAYREIHARLPRHHVLKLDTDALVIRPFLHRLAALLYTHPSAGMVGSVELTADGGRTGSWFTQRVYRMSKAASRWDVRPFYRVNLFGSNARMRRLVQAAYRHGYATAYAPCGGAYLLTASALDRIAAMSELHDQQLVGDDAVTEDIFYSIVIHAAGLRVVEQNARGDVFGVCWKGLPARSLEQVLDRGHAIIHSVKDHPPFTEAATREFFQKRRLAVSAPPAMPPTPAP